MNDCTATTTTLHPDAGEIPHRCGLTTGHTRPTHMCFYCGHGWDA